MDDKAAILIAESIASFVDAMGMKAFNDERIQNGCSPGYSEGDFNCISQNIRDKITEFKECNTSDK